MKYLLIIFLIFVQFSCVRNKPDHSAGTPTHLDITPTIKNKHLFTVDLDRAEEKDSCNLSFFFKSARCIRLEENEKALIGGISKLIAFNDRLYVLDAYVAKSLMMFDLNGKFVGKIGQLGKGPGEYVQLVDFTVDTDKNEIILLDVDHIHTYDLNGNYLKSVRFNRGQYTITTFQYYNELVYTNICAFQKAEDDCLLQSVNIEDGQRVTRFLKSKEHNKGWNDTHRANMNYFIPKLDPPYLFRHSFMDTIFSITPEGLSPYLVVKSKDMITEKDLELPPNTDPLEFLSAINKINKIYIICNFFETIDYIYFKYFKYRESWHAVYNKKSNVTQNVGELWNDLVYKGNQQINPNFIFYDKKGAYEYVSGMWLPDLLTCIHEKKLKAPFDEQLKGLNEESNPVIFYYEFK